jgi:DNA-binding HxlR family transcriptional regulator
MPTSRTYGDACAVARSLDIVGERWALLVIRELLLGPKRFADLATGLPGISPNVLSQRLHTLTGAGVIRHRRMGPASGSAVYELTGWGRELEPVLLQLASWGAAGAPAPDGDNIGIDSLMLGLKVQYRPAPAKVTGETYELRVSYDTFTIRATEESLIVRRASAEAPAATAETDVATLRALVAGDLTVPQARRNGDLRLSGPLAAIRRLSKLLVPK